MNNKILFVGGPHHGEKIDANESIGNVYYFPVMPKMPLGMTKDTGQQSERFKVDAYRIKYSPNTFSNNCVIFSYDGEE